MHTEGFGAKLLVLDSTIWDTLDSQIQPIKHRHIMTLHMTAFNKLAKAYLEADVTCPALLHCFSMRNVDSSHIRLVPACLSTQSQYVTP